MHKIILKSLEISNFLSVGPPLPFDYDRHYGLNYIYGLNKDIEGVRNGVGKCVEGNTKIDIIFENTEIENKFLDFIKDNKPS